MKKNLLVLFLVCLLFLTGGCGNKQEKIDKKMEEYATDYYNRYIKNYVTGLDIPEISVANLEAAVKAGAEYEMDIFKDCTETSHASLTLDDKGEVTDVELHMNCKK